MVWQNRKASWLGIDWGTRTIKFAILDRIGTEFKFRKQSIVRRDVPAGSASGTDVECWTPKNFPAGIVREGRFRVGRAACLLPSYLEDLRTLDIPEGTLTVRQAIAAGELADTLHEEVGERVLDLWTPAVPPASRVAAGTNVWSLPSPVALEVANAIGASGVDTEVMDSLPFVIGRAIELAAGPNSRTHVALDWGYTGANLCVLRGAQPVFCRSIRGTGVVRLAHALADSLGVTAEEAEELLTKTGLPGRSTTSELQELTAEVLGDAIRELVAQIDRTLSYVESEWPSLELQELWLFGGGSTIPNIADSMNDRLGLKTRFWSLKGGSDQPAEDGLFAFAAALSMLGYEA